ncbi:MAG: hypothetical protein JO215_03500 [Ktedonobacteraceae bacterium]|nr:hypothetical protein [Ktedonobacteraceae bacterium]
MGGQVVVRTRGWEARDDGQRDAGGEHARGDGKQGVMGAEIQEEGTRGWARTGLFRSAPPRPY